jgi:tetratricopeptide (TPR) repeat protein
MTPEPPREPPWLEPPAVLGPCRLLRRLGAGAAGVVYLAALEEDRPWGAAGTRVALKLLHPGRRLVPRALQRLRREAELGMRVRHPAVVRTYEAGTTQCDELELHYLLLEYVEGRTLAAIVAELGVVPEPLLRDLALQAAQGLAAIHAEGALHRDVKPLNLMVTPDHQLKLMDLGLAHLIEGGARLTVSGTFLGTVEYAAPEQIEGITPSPATDLYALGVVLYEAATGVNPFTGGNQLAVMQRQLTLQPRPASEVAAPLSPFLDELLATLLRKRPEERFPGARELAAVLEAGEVSSWWRERDLAARRGSRSPLPRRLRDERDGTLVGRERELAELRALWEDAKRGDGRAALLEGEGGVGKSRLVRELLRGIEGERDELHVLYGSYAPGAVGIGSGALSQALGEIFAPELLESELLRRLPGLAALVPRFAALLREAPAPPDSPPLGAEAFAALFAGIAASLAGERPTVWVVEDLHHTTADTRAYLLAMARAARGRRLLLLGTTRRPLPAVERENLMRLEHARMLHLGRLSPREVVRMVEAAGGSARAAEELGGRIAVKSDGNPYFALEIVAELKRRGVLQPAHSSWAGLRLASLEVPSTVRELLLARLEGFAREERSLLDLAAVAGFEFDPDLLARVREQRRLHVLETLAEIERKHRLVRSAGRGFRFDHHLLQEAIYDTVPAPLRREYHALLADALQARHAERGAAAGAETAVFLAHHYLRGDRLDGARPHLLPALDRLASAYQHEAFLDLASAALTALARHDGELACDVLLRQAHSYELQGLHEEARRAADEALQLAPDEGRRLQGELRLAAADVLSWRLAPASERLQACLAAAEGLLAEGTVEQAAVARRAVAEALLQLGSLALLAGQAEQTLAACDRLRALADELGDRSLAALADARAGDALLGAGEPEAARRRFQAAIGVFRASGARQEQASATTLLGAAYRGLPECRYDLARAALLEALAANQESGFQRGEVTALVKLAQVELEAGALAAAAEHATRGRQLAQSLGMTLMDAYARMLLGACARARGEPAGGDLGAALAGFRALAMPRGVAEAAFALGRWHGERGEHAAALPLLEEAAALVTEHRLDEPGSLPAAWLALLGARSPGLVAVAPGPTLARGEAHLVLHLAGGGDEPLAAATTALDTVARGMPADWVEGFWRHNPAAVRLREALAAAGRPAPRLAPPNAAR